MGYRSTALIIVLFQRLYNTEGCRAYRQVLHGDIADLVEFLSVGMREFPTCFRPDIINATIMIFGQKRAWQLLKHIIMVFIDPEIFFGKVLRF